MKNYPARCQSKSPETGIYVRHPDFPCHCRFTLTSRALRAARRSFRYVVIHFQDRSSVAFLRPKFVPKSTSYHVWTKNLPDRFLAGTRVNRYIVDTAIIWKAFSTSHSYTEQTPLSCLSKDPSLWLRKMNYVNNNRLRKIPVMSLLSKMGRWGRAIKGMMFSYQTAVGL